MELALRFGGALLGIVLLLYGLMLVVVRIYIHTFKKRIEATETELAEVRSELADLKATVDRQPMIHKPAQEMETVQVQ